MGSAALMTAQPITMTVGCASVDGVVQFQLVSQDSHTFNVSANVSAGDSSMTIASKIKAVFNGNSGWAAQSNGGTLWFLHSSGGSWNYVGVVSGATNTAGASMKFNNSCPAGSSVSVTSPASGSGVKGYPSYLTLAPSGVSPYTVVLAPGQSAKSIVDGICAYLANNGINHTRISDTKVYFIPLGTSSNVSLQTNDSGLQGAVGLSDAWSTQSGVIDR